MSNQAFSLTQPECECAWLVPVFCFLWEVTCGGGQRGWLKNKLISRPGRWEAGAQISREIKMLRRTPLPSCRPLLINLYAVFISFQACPSLRRTRLFDCCSEPPETESVCCFELNKTGFLRCWDDESQGGKMLYGDNDICSHLYPVLWQLRLYGEHFSSIHIWIMSFVKSFLQFLQLIRCKNGPEKNNRIEGIFCLFSFFLNHCFLHSFWSFKPFLVVNKTNLIFLDKTHIYVFSKID